MGLKPFRNIPRDLAEWTRWCNDQDLGTSEESTSESSEESTLTNIELVNFSIAHEVATLVGNAATFLYSDAQSWFVDLEPATGNVTLTLSGGPGTGEYGEMNIRVQQDGTANRTITWAGGTFLWPGGSQPTLTATADAIDIFHFQTIDGGATWAGSAIQDMS